jgi:hypothetical protein
MVLWRNKTVRVQARMVPHYFWMGASIDVLSADERVLSTGAQRFTFSGSHCASFKDGNSEHKAELIWRRARWRHFPYQLLFDGLTIDDSEVEIENWYMGYISAVAVLIISLLCLFFAHVF